MQLEDAEIDLLEDCHADWRALWEMPARWPNLSIADCIAFLVSFIESGYLTTLEVTSWGQANTAPPMELRDALIAIRKTQNYAPPTNEGELFYLLSITRQGEAAISRGT